MTPTPPPFPEAALRAVLSAAVAAWAGAPADGGRSAEDAPPRIYVDAFAGAELQFGTGVLREAWEPMRAEAAIRALDRACAGPAPRPVSAFVEEDPAHLQRIYGELEELVGGERLRATRDLASLAAGEASLVEAPFASIAADVARLAAGARAFFWMAPATARALPWAAVEPILAVPGATLLIRFPHADFEKQARHGGSLADLPGFARRIVEGCSALLADPKHAWLAGWRSDATGGTAAALAGVRERYQALLARAAGDRVVKPVQLESADGAHTWCFLVTADSAVAEAIDGGAGGSIEAAAPEIAPPEPKPAQRRTPKATKRAAAAKPASVSEIVGEDAESVDPTSALNPSNGDTSTDDPVSAAESVESVESPESAESGESREVEARRGAEAGGPSPAPVKPSTVSRPAEMDRSPPPAEVLDLFPDDVAAPGFTPRTDAAALGAALEARFGARTATWGEVAASFADEDVTVDALKAALRHLRRGGRAVYRALRTTADEIAFPANPAPPARTVRRLKPGADDGFFGSGDDPEPD